MSSLTEYFSNSVKPFISWSRYKRDLALFRIFSSENILNIHEKWDIDFPMSWIRERVKCKGNKDNKILKVYEICNNNAAANNCKYNNTTNYKGNGVYEKWYLGKMEVNLNDGKKKKYLYFQFN